MSFTVDGWRGEVQLKASAWRSHQSRKVAGAVPAWVEFEVDDIDAATQELQDRGYTLLVRARHEPWGQVITCLITDTGLMVGIVRNPEE
jgi:uncharacterized glyoxalase superfamily protein PhnB